MIFNIQTMLISILSKPIEVVVVDVVIVVVSFVKKLSIINNLCQKNKG